MLLLSLTCFQRAPGGFRANFNCLFFNDLNSKGGRNRIFRKTPVDTVLVL